VLPSGDRQHLSSSKLHSCKQACQLYSKQRNWNVCTKASNITWHVNFKVDTRDNRWFPWHKQQQMNRNSILTTHTASQNTVWTPAEIYSRGKASSFLHHLLSTPCLCSKHFSHPSQTVFYLWLPHVHMLACL